MTEPTPLVFLDVETTGLDDTRHEMVEVAWIVRPSPDPTRRQPVGAGTVIVPHMWDVEQVVTLPHTTIAAQEAALEVNRYHDRDWSDPVPVDRWLPAFLATTAEATIIGAQPHFDIGFIHALCRRVGMQPTWYHRLYDVESMAAPFIANRPGRLSGLRDTAAALGLDTDDHMYAAHTALGDARLARAIFDHVWWRIDRPRVTPDNPQPKAATTW